MVLRSRTYTIPEGIEEAVEFCYEQGWTDGLPVVPPTQGAIERIIEYLGRDPNEVVGIVPPKKGAATIEKIAINCVMGGCLKEYVPIVIAVLEAMLEPPFNLNNMQASSHCGAPLAIVSGPAVKTLGFNVSHGALGHGSRANATIGRAVRLILWNIGGGYPGLTCITTHGQPGYYSFCIAEDQDHNPWEPLHVDRGFAAEETVVTVVVTEAPHAIATAAGYATLEDVLYILADAMTPIGSYNIAGGEAVLVLGPQTAAPLAAGGLSKQDLKNELMQRAVRPACDTRHRKHWSTRTDGGDEEDLIPFIHKPEDLIVLTTGAVGSLTSPCSLYPGWGGQRGIGQSKVVQFPNS